MNTAGFDVAEHMKKIQARMEKKQQFFPNDNKEIFYRFKDGEQILRFVGNFITTKVHYIGNTRKQMRLLRLYDDIVFQGDAKLAQLVNCANWNIKKEAYEDNGCVICKLNKIARDILKSALNDSIDEKTQKEFKALKYRTDSRFTYRWHVIDRANPYIADGIKGFKIASFGQELFEQLSVIQNNYQVADISDEERGIDIKIARIEKDRITYIAQQLIEGTKLAVTPLTDEEKEWERYDLLTICGKQADQDRLYELLLEKWQELISTWADGETTTTKKEDNKKTTSADKKQIEKPITEQKEPDMSEDDEDEIPF